MLALDPRVEVAYQLGDGGSFLVKMNNSERWMKVTSGGGGDLPPPGGPLKVAVGDPDPGGQSRGFILGWLDETSVQKELGAAGRGLKIQPVARDVLGESNYAQGMRVQAHADAPPSGLTPVTIRGEGYVIRAKVDHSTQTLYVSRSDLPPALERSPDWLGKQLKPADVQKISQSAKSSPSGVDYDVALRTGADTLVEEASHAHKLIETGRYVEAEQHLSRLISANEHVAELKVLRAIAGLRRGRLQRASDDLNELAGASHENRAAFLDEVNSRLQEYCGDIQFAHNGRTYELRQIVNGRQARPASATDATSYEADVYVMDSFAPPNADWSPANLTNTINELISGGIGRGSYLPRGGAANFRPSVIYDGGGGGGGGRYILRGHTRYDTPTPRQPLRLRPFPPLVACDGDDEEDGDDEGDCGELRSDRPILLISDGQDTSEPQ